MKTYFIINPAAGQGNRIKELEAEILMAAKTNNADIQMYFTKSPGDARDFVKKICEETSDTRFIACGGDGTLSEVLNGAIGFDRAQIGVYPIGTGNDFCRNFKTNGDFLSVEAQLNGETVSCDAIKYSFFSDGKEKTGYCANMFNIGFDCNVADLTAKMKKKPKVKSRG